MSFIAVTYGYNMFSIFNLQSATLPLIDNIVVNCFEDLVTQLQKRVEQHGKEIDLQIAEENSLKKKIIQLEEEKSKEEAKIEEQKKIEEEKMKELMKDKKVKTNPPQIKKDDKKKGPDTSPLGLVLEEIKQTEQKIVNCKKNQETYGVKKKGLAEIFEKFKSIDRTNVKIDLVDMNTQEKITIFSKGDLYAAQYLTEKIPYELNMVSQNEKGEAVYESMTFKGDFFRTIDEDIKFEEAEKNNKNKKNVKKK